MELEKIELDKMEEVNYVVGDNGNMSNDKVENNLSKDIINEVIVSNENLPRTTISVSMATLSPAQVPSRLVILPKIKTSSSSSDLIQAANGKIVMRSNQRLVTNPVVTRTNNISKTVSGTTSIVIPSASTTTIPGKPQIMFHKSLNNPIKNIVPVSVSTQNGTKQQYAYLGTFLKPVITSNSKTSENQILTHLPVGLVPAPTNQKILLTPIGSTSKLPTKARRVSIDTIQSNVPKIANVLFPVPAPVTIKPKSTNTMINLKITNGELQSDNEGVIKVLCENKINAPALPPLQLITKTTSNNTVVTSATLTSTAISCSTLTPISTITVTSTGAQSQTVQSSCSSTSVIAQTEGDVSANNAEKEYTLSIPENEYNTTDVESSFELSIKENSSDSVEVTCMINNTEESKQEILTNKEIKEEVENLRYVEQPLLKKVHDIAILKKPKHLQDNDWKKDTITIQSVNINTDNTSISVEKVPHVSCQENRPEVEKVQVTKIVPERRRKSHNTILKDYDEIEFSPSLSSDKEDKEEPRLPLKYKSNADITFTKLSLREELATKSKLALDDIQIEVIKKETLPLSFEEDFDPVKILEWNDGIGTLPGSDLKFHVNEFGFMQMVTDSEIALIKTNKKETESKTNSKSKHKKLKTKNTIECCKMCGLYGVTADFLSSSFCSNGCAERYIKKEKETKRKDRKATSLNKHKLQSDFDNNNKGDSYDLQRSTSATPAQSDEDTNDTTIGSKYLYPWLGGKKGFSWAKYLTHMNAKAAPVKLFKDPFPYTKNGFKVGMKLEGIDPQHPSYYCVLTVVETIGYRIRLHFDGYPEMHDFWVNADSLNIFPAGWCDKNNHKLHPPLGFTQATFNWNTYLKQCRAQPAPKILFLNRPENSPCPNGFRLGMKLEAVDRKHSSLVCVATVADIMDNRILVHFDSWDDVYDYWADPSSPYIHPVGWCEEKGHSLTPPNDYKDPNTFSWDRYLKDKKCQAAPSRAFKQKPPNGFKKGMRLECVDRRVPKLIRVATVDDVRDHQIRISFDGWPDKYSYWVDDDSTDIHPLGWCQKTAHALQPPLTPEDIYSTECSTPGCRGLGNTKGPQFETHNTVSFCPYSDQNFNKEHIPDRLIGIIKEKLDEAVPLSKEPKRHAADSTTSGKVGRPPKVRRVYESDEEWTANDKARKRKRKRDTSSPDDNEENSPDNFPVKIRAVPDSVLIKSVTQDNFDPELIPDPNKITPFNWNKHSKILNSFVSNFSNPKNWTEEEVVEFVSSIPSCKELSNMFSQHKIDGEALLMLSQNDLTTVLGFKLGPAIKLYNSIVLLRQNVLACC